MSSAQFHARQMNAEHMNAEQLSTWLTAIASSQRMRILSHIVD